MQITKMLLTILCANLEGLKMFELQTRALTLGLNGNAYRTVKMH
jgi:hypothetical protein